jgi:hypothetical protein
VYNMAGTPDSAKRILANANFTVRRVHGKGVSADLFRSHRLETRWMDGQKPDQPVGATGGPFDWGPYSVEGSDLVVISMFEIEIAEGRLTEGVDDVQLRNV